jgi:hypothetical protein
LPDIATRLVGAEWLNRLMDRKECERFDREFEEKSKS